MALQRYQRKLTTINGRYIKISGTYAQALHTPTRPEWASADGLASAQV